MKKLFLLASLFMLPVIAMEKSDSSESDDSLSGFTTLDDNRLRWTVGPDRPKRTMSSLYDLFNAKNRQLERSPMPDAARKQRVEALARRKKQRSKSCFSFLHRKKKLY